MDSTKMQASAGERRHAVRHSIVIDITLDTGPATTRDISSAGVFFVTREQLTVEAPVQFVVDARHLLMTPALTVRCHGRVVRVETQEGRFGVAAALDDIEFERVRESPAPAATR